MFSSIDLQSDDIVIVNKRREIGEVMFHFFYYYPEVHKVLT